jgi:hypothetical protein
MLKNSKNLKKLLRLKREWAFNPKLSVAFNEMTHLQVYIDSHFLAN